jgi:hypothetical protein
MVLGYSDGQLVGGTDAFKSRMVERPVSEDPRETLRLLEEELDRVDDLELLEGDFLPPDDNKPVPLDLHGGMTQLVTRLAAAKRAGTSYSQVLEWQEQGLLHPVRLDFASRPEVLYSQREVDKVFRKLKIAPRRYETSEDASPKRISMKETTSVPDPWGEIQRLQDELINARAAAESERGWREALAEQLTHERQEKSRLIKALSGRPRWLRRKRAR